jgi:hypothetical protein
MKHQTTKTFKYGFAALLLAGGSLVGNVVPAVNAQDQSAAKTPSSRTNSGGRDPFKKYEPPRYVPRKSGQIMPHSVQARIEQYKAQKQAAMSARVAAPKPTTAFLLSEITVIGISRTPRGYAAIVEASPIKLAYVIYPGEKFYDGQLVAIEDNRLVFRRELVFGDGRRERSVEIKTLRQPSTVEALAAVKSAHANSPAGEADKKADEKPAADKP